MPFLLNGKYYSGRGTGATASDPITPSPEIAYPVTGTFTDRSTSTDTTPGTTKQVMAANANRVRWFVQNLSTTSVVSLYYGNVKFMELDPREPKWKSIGDGDWTAADRGIIQVASSDASVAVIAHEA